MSQFFQNWGPFIGFLLTAVFTSGIWLGIGRLQAKHEASERARREDRERQDRQSGKIQTNLMAVEKLTFRVGMVESAVKRVDEKIDILSESWERRCALCASKLVQELGRGSEHSGQGGPKRSGGGQSS